jgi:putative ABC transport system substrate-binding protein
MSGIRRREFIALLGGAAAWPLEARAQQSERMRRVGVITNALADDTAAQSRLTAFVQGLQQLGWSDSRNVRIDTRWGAGDTERVRRYAAGFATLSRHAPTPSRRSPERSNSSMIAERSPLIDSRW